MPTIESVQRLADEWTKKPFPQRYWKLKTIRVDQYDAERQVAVLEVWVDAVDQKPHVNGRGQQKQLSLDEIERVLLSDDSLVEFLGVVLRAEPDRNA